MEESIDYVGVVYQLEVKGTRTRNHIGGSKHVQMGTILVGESRDYLGFVYQFGVKGMRARKHVQYQIGADGTMQL